MQLHLSFIVQEPQTTEQWREIPGSEGCYDVSDFGRVRSWYYNKGWQTTPLYRKSSASKLGYVYYRLWIGDKPKNYAAHRLVMLAFVGPSTMEPNHKNGDKSNNRIDNLEYMTHADNIQHSFKVLGRKARRTPGPETDRDREIRAMVASGISQREVARHLGISQPYVSYIVTMKVRPPR